MTASQHNATDMALGSRQPLSIDRQAPRRQKIVAERSAALSDLTKSIAAR